MSTAQGGASGRSRQGVGTSRAGARRTAMWTEEGLMLTRAPTTSLGRTPVSISPS